MANELTEAKHMAYSPSSIPETSTKPKPELISKNREEGELSSSDEEIELPAQPDVRTGNANAAIQAMPVSAGQKKTQSINSSVINSGRSYHASNPESSVHFQSRLSVQSTQHKKFVKTSKPSTSVWCQPSGRDDNLVIRFSDDDDSSSDSEDYIQEQCLESKSNAAGDYGKMKPPTPLSAKSEILREPGSEIKPVPKKVLLNRPFVSAISKINGANSRVYVPSLVQQESRVKNFSSANTNLAVPQHGCKQDVKLDDGKLQGLREQIAIRESELIKLKSAQQSKETVSGDFTSSFNNNVTRKSRAASAEPKEPEKKRLKFTGPYSNQLNSPNLLEIPAAKSKQVSKSLSSEKSDLTKNMKFDCGQPNKITHANRIQPDIARLKKRDDNNWMVVSSGNTSVSMNDGGEFSAGCRQHDRSNARENPYIVVNHQTAPLTNMTPSSFADKLKAGESKNQSKIHGLKPSPSPPNSDALVHNLDSIRSNGCCKSLAGNKSPKGAAEKLESSEDSPKNGNRWNGMDNVNVAGHVTTSIESLLEIEDLQDKELEEAQEYRRRCEIEERNALRNYRKAQRALVEANARCSHRYRERDLFAARFQSFIVDDSHLLWSSRQQEHVGSRLNLSQNISGDNVDLVPKSNHRQIDYNVLNQMGYDSTSGCVNKAPLKHKLGSDICSEPDGSTSELMPHKGDIATNRVCSPSNDPNISVDDDEETLSIDHESNQPNQEHVEGNEGISDRVEKIYPLVSNQDLLVLEASLRSKLFAQLGMRSKSKKNCQNDDSVEPAVEIGPENDPESEKSQRSTEGLPYSVALKSQQSLFRGTVRSEETGNEALVHKDNATVESEADEFRECMQLKTSIAFSPPSILRSAFGSPPSSSRELQSKIQENQLFNEQNQEKVSDQLTRDTSYHGCNLEIDPFWPLCMYELRGKCNDEECSWQHVNDRQAGSSKDGRKYNGGTELSQSLGQSLQKSFSAYLSVSRPLQIEPFIAEQYRLEIQGSWSRQSLYLQNGGSNNFKQDVVDYIQSLERALLILNQEANRTEGMKKALIVLSRALEANPTSVVLWIVYLLIYYSNKKCAGKDDDMFFYAVKHNEESYELWLLYINSRMLVEDRLLAYDSALTALSHRASNPDLDVTHTSSCILDLFLQMMDCLCMSGNDEMTLQRIHKLLLSTTNSDAIFSFLTVSDKCIFWVCCVYVVIYRKLPDFFVQQFECEKDFFLVEWPSIETQDDQKQLAVKLMEMAMESIETNIGSESDPSETNLRSVHLFALTHIGCIVALENPELSRKLLEKYIKLYPSCLELFLMSERMQKHSFRDLNFAGFEEALNKWPKENPGIQFIWNQYVQYVLENGRVDFAKEIMGRWFQNPPSEPNLSTKNSNKVDEMFEFLNLALYRLLMNDHVEARSASDSALKAAPRENYKHCVREHAMFLLTCSSQLKDSMSLTSILNILRSYMLDARNFPASDPLSRRFIQSVKKTSVKHLINGILSPICPDSSLVNLVLEVWHGPSLLPCKFRKVKDMVDFVEGIMEITPSNYHLAFSVCNLFIKELKSVDITSVSVLFWASSLLVNSIYQSIPVAPEYVYVEATVILGNMTGIRETLEMFHKTALSVYPFSIKLWRSYFNLCKTMGDDTMAVAEAAKERGIKLD